MASAVQNQFNVLILVTFCEGDEPPFLLRLTYYFLSGMKHALSLPSLVLVPRHPHTPNILMILFYDPILRLHALIESLPIRDPTLVWFQSKNRGLVLFPGHPLQGKNRPGS